MVIFFCCFFLQIKAWNNFSATEDWKELKTKSAKIVFPKRLSAAAEVVAYTMDQLDALYGELFDWHVKDLIPIVLIDNADSINGGTLAVAKKGIELYVTPPDNDELPYGSLNAYNDWLKLLVIHEAAHYYTQDITRNFWSVLRDIFGSLFLPNAVLSRWIEEGLAVYFETVLSESGRGRSSIWENILRARVLEYKSPTLPQLRLSHLSIFYPYLPFGATVYQYGFYLIHQAAKEESQVIADFCNTSANGIVPFLYDLNISKVLNKNWSEVWFDWITESSGRLQQQINELKKQPVTQPTWITHSTEDASNVAKPAAISPDGKYLAFTMTSSDRRQGLYLLDLHTKNTVRLMDRFSGAGAAFSKDNQFLFSSQERVQNQFVSYSDLEVVHLASNKRTWLSHKLRAKNPDLHPHQSLLTFTISNLTETGLAIAPVFCEETTCSLGAVEILFWPNPYGKVSNPKFSLDGEKIFFSLQNDQTPTEQIAAWDLKQKSLQVLTNNQAMNQHVSISPLGKIFFISNLTGIENLYEFTDDYKMVLWSNTISGVYFPIFDRTDPKKYYASFFNAHGLDLAEASLIPNTDLKLITVQPPQMPHHPLPQVEKTHYTTQPYQSIVNLWPRYWFPYFSTNGSNFAFGASTTGFDILNIHSYDLFAAYNTSVSNVEVNATYSNTTLNLPLSFSFYQSFFPLIFIQPNDHAYQVSNIFSQSITFPFLQTYSRFDATIGLSYQRFYAISRLGFSYADQIDTTHAMNLKTLFTFNNLERSSLSILPEGGRSISVKINFFSPFYRPLYTTLTTNYSEFFRLSKHTILSPNFQFSFTPNINKTIATPRIFGRQGAFFNSIENSDYLRGYPNIVQAYKYSVTSSLQLVFPLWKIYQGIHTLPIFFTNFSGYLFADATYAALFYSKYQFHPFWFPATGGGFFLDGYIVDFFPFNISMNAHHGFNKNFADSTDIFFNFALGNTFF